MFENLQKSGWRAARVLARILAVGGILLVAACSAPQTLVQGINDPYEAHNRATHQVNLELDRILVKPASKAYGKVLPKPLRDGVSHFASNVNLPGVVVNDLLQLKIDNALKNSTRFLFNTTIGLGGILDPATAMGLPEQPNDFGETLYVWGLPEGPYVELPVLGPSTQRAMIGKVVDLFTNPLAYKLPLRERRVVTVAGIGSKLGDRYKYSSTIDSILYDSADSYAQARLLYLQHRRFEVSGGATNENTDIFNQLYGQ